MMSLKTVNLDVSTILAEQIKDQFLEQLDHGSEKELHPNLKLSWLNNRKDFCDFAKYWTDS